MQIFGRYNIILILFTPEAVKTKSCAGCYCGNDIMVFTNGMVDTSSLEIRRMLPVAEGAFCWAAVVFFTYIGKVGLVIFDKAR